MSRRSFPHACSPDGSQAANSPKESSAQTYTNMKNQGKIIAGILFGCWAATMHAAAPGAPEDNGLTPKADTVYINVPPDWHNNSTTDNTHNMESMGIAIANNGNIIVGWEDDGDGITDLEGVWTLL